MLKYIHNLGDARVVATWQENPYYQYFAGKATLQWDQPYAARD